MYKVLLFGLSLLSFSAYSQVVDVKLMKNIAQAVDALHSDTVNEGDMTANVASVDGMPEMQCTLASYREAGKGLAKCNISFDVESNYSDETEYCSRECFLIHIYDLKTLKVLDRVEGLSQSCIENLASGCD
jgi:hypothetical protein